MARWASGDQRAGDPPTAARPAAPPAGSVQQRRAEPYRQAPALAQAGVILAPVRYLMLLLGNVVPAILVQLEWQGGHPGIREEAILLPRPDLQRHRPDPCNSAPFKAYLRERVGRFP